MKLPSVCPSITKFSQDWIISFFDIVHDDSWPWYLVTDEDRFLKKKKEKKNQIGPETRFFAIFSSLVHYFS